MKPGYTGASPWDYPLDQQGHVASKLHSRVAAYSSYIGLVVTDPAQGICYSIVLAFLILEGKVILCQLVHPSLLHGVHVW